MVGGCETTPEAVWKALCLYDFLYFIMYLCADACRKPNFSQDDKKVEI